MTLRVNFNVLGLMLALSLALVSCKKPDDEGTEASSGFDRTAMLTYTADEIILPSYDTFVVRLDTMEKKSQAFTANPNLTTLTEFRAAWVAAYIQWQKVELFDVGPALNKGLRYYMNIYPANPTNIAANIANTSANLEVPAAYTAQGFPAFDYLLNGVGATDNDIITYYTTDADAAARLAYITRLMTLMQTKTTAVHDQWTTGGYRDLFISKSGMDVSSSLPQLVNGYVMNYERYIRSGKFGLPSGAMAGGTPSPSLVEALYKKDISLTLATAAHQASVDFFNGKSVISGTEGYSLKTYLDAIQAKDSQTGDALTDAINDQFDMIDTKLALLSEDFGQLIQNDNDKMVATYTEMQLLIRLLKVDMTSALSITITYVDNDGD